MMPKGVEHKAGVLTLTQRLSVIPSMMPKGVEHVPLAFYDEQTRRVIPSMMPKGVEHANSIVNGMSPTA